MEYHRGCCGISGQRSVLVDISLGSFKPACIFFTDDGVPTGPSWRALLWRFPVMRLLVLTFPLISLCWLWLIRVWTNMLLALFLDHLQSRKLPLFRMALGGSISLLCLLNWLPNRILVTRQGLAQCNPNKLPNAIGTSSPGRIDDANFARQGVLCRVCHLAASPVSKAADLALAGVE
ncbi:hypothetical protein Nepgr_007871 [Nepenthes gracilis]|uniref:Uncharacterized protein n=1 Tax=Nepenthes gracilis TaxID=150966 RepID=A0AAD3XIX6_NEPGR|nr:hypothetical protein Nepgr_007871 [Nepenthes gracilis]